MKLPIRLDQFLKLVGAASTGGHAKFLIQESLVSVGEEVESRRGRQLHGGEIVTVEGTEFTVPSAEAGPDSPTFPE